MSVVVTIISTKGGVCKTTNVANLGGLIADMGLHCLLIDGDEQPSLSKYYRLKKTAHLGITHCLMTGVIPHDAISTIDVPLHSGKLDLIIGDAKEQGLLRWIQPRLDRAQRMRQVIQNSRALDAYDVIIIDTQGAKTEVVDTMALAADILLSPIPPDILSAREFRQGTMELLEHLGTAGVGLGQIKALICRQDRTKDARLISDELRKDFITLHGKVDMLSTVIPYAKAYKEAVTARIPVHLHEYTKAGMSASAARVMHELVWELIPSLRGEVAHSLKGKQHDVLDKIVSVVLS